MKATLGLSILFLLLTSCDIFKNKTTIIFDSYSLDVGNVSIYDTVFVEFKSKCLECFNDNHRKLSVIGDCSCVNVEYELTQYTEDECLLKVKAKFTKEHTGFFEHTITIKGDYINSPIVLYVEGKGVK